MPGVRELLDALAPRDDVYLALLTGNYEAGARLKLEYFDLWKYFRVRRVRRRCAAPQRARAEGAGARRGVRRPGVRRRPTRS